MLKFIKIAAACAALIASGIWMVRAEYARWSPGASSELAGRIGVTPQDAFVHGDMSALDISTLADGAIPWRVLSAAIALDRADGSPYTLSPEAVEDALRGFGFLFPKTLANASEVRVRAGRPLGLVDADVTRILVPVRMDVATLGCAACHASPVYGPDGAAKPETAWLGAPNRSLDLGGFYAYVDRVLRSAIAEEDTLLLAIRQMDKEISIREVMTIKHAVLPMIRDRLAAGTWRGRSFLEGAPGFVGAADDAARALGLPRRAGGYALQPVPALWSLPFRSSFLASGTLGSEPDVEARAAPVTPDDASGRPAADLARMSAYCILLMGTPAAHLGDAVDLSKTAGGFLAKAEPPAFPGPVDAELAEKGRGIYGERCASCHGTYGDGERPKLSSYPNWRGDVGTDRTLLTASSELAKASAGSAFSAIAHPAPTPGYVAPPLTGIWMRAPYLHNGSVPTLRHLLDPASRPTSFQVGGHALDFEAVGIRGIDDGDGRLVFPSDYQPWAKSALLDTRVPGFSNAGHDKEAEGLSEEDRAALIEFLKRL